MIGAGWTVLLLMAVLAAALISLAVGRYPVSPHTVFSVLVGQLLPIQPSWPDQAETVIMNIRLPRVMAALLVGCALSASGAAYQGIFRNPLVSPDILGVASGAGAGAALAILMGASAPGTQMAAFIGGIAAVSLTFLIGGRNKTGNTAMTMVLAGIMVAMVFQALISLLKVLADPINTLPAITFWLMGSLASAGFPQLAAAAPGCLSGLAVLLLLRWRLSVMAFNDEEAQVLGVNVARIRLAVIVAATLMTAAAVAISGVIAMVGLVVPHLARMIVGADFRNLLPVSALMGGLFMLLVDNLARTLSASEIPLGILTALIGAPVFFSLLTKANQRG